MKPFVKILLVVALISNAGYTFAKPAPVVKVKGSEIVDRHLSGFHAVNLEGSFDVYITQSATESVKVEAPSDVINRIMTVVEDGTLKIYNKHDSWHWGDWWGHHKKIAIYVTAK